VRISGLLGMAFNFSDMLKLCVDIKGGGDAEQVNAIWYIYHHKKIPCIMVTGDILCYMYSITMGLPSVLIASDIIYMTKGIPLGPIPESIKLKNRLNRHIGLFNNILKSFSDLANAGGKMDALIENIKININKQISVSNVSFDTKKFINALIQLKALDIANYLQVINGVIKPKTADIIANINKLLVESYGATIENTR